jgi:hypothetical protein
MYLINLLINLLDIIKIMELKTAEMEWPQAPNLIETDVQTHC